MPAALQCATPREGCGTPGTRQQLCVIGTRMALALSRPGGDWFTSERGVLARARVPSASMLSFEEGRKFYNLPHGRRNVRRYAGTVRLSPIREVLRPVPDGPRRVRRPSSAQRGCQVAEETKGAAPRRCALPQFRRHAMPCPATPCQTKGGDLGCPAAVRQLPEGSRGMPGRQ